MSELLLQTLLFWLTTASVSTQTAEQAEPELPLNPALSLTVEAPEAGPVAIGQQRIPVLYFHAKAGCGSDVQIERVHLRQMGLGSPADIQGVYLGKETGRISSVVAPKQSDRSLTVHVRGWSIPACTSDRVGVYMNLSSTARAGSNYWFQLDDPAVDVTPSPIQVQIVSEPDAQTAVFRSVPAPTGGVTARVLQPTERIRFGTARTVARVQLESTGERTHQIHSILFKNEGSAQNEDLQEFFLETTSGRTLTKKTTQMDGEYVLLHFNPPYLLESGDSLHLELKADVRVGSSESVRFRIEEPSDIEAITH